jgi:hypothetical protein
MMDSSLLAVVEKQKKPGDCYTIILPACKQRSACDAVASRRFWLDDDDHGQKSAGQSVKKKEQYVTISCAPLTILCRFLFM